jgi:hypothetical protein
MSQSNVATSVIFVGGEFSPFCKKEKKNHILSKFPVLFSEGEKKIAKKQKILI